VPSVSAIEADIVAEGRRLLLLAEERDVTLRLLGGVAVLLRAPDGIPPRLARDYNDLDFVTPRASARAAAGLLGEHGYEPHVPFNALHGNERLLFFDDENGRQVDVFVAAFRMSHKIPLGDRLALEQQTVPLAELLLTKLQIAELNEKDVRDSLALLHTHPVGSEDGEVVNAGRIAGLLSEDWGLWRTFTANLATTRERAADYGLAAADREMVAERIDALRERIDREPKSRAWKLRARIGERKRWYETPEEVGGGV
jgi:hypothetical protein